MPDIYSLVVVEAHVEKIIYATPTDLPTERTLTIDVEYRHAEDDESIPSYVFDALDDLGTPALDFEVASYHEVE